MTNKPCAIVKDLKINLSMNHLTVNPPKQMACGIKAAHIVYRWLFEEADGEQDNIVADAKISLRVSRRKNVSSVRRLYGWKLIQIFVARGALSTAKYGKYKQYVLHCLWLPTSVKGAPGHWESLKASGRWLSLVQYLLLTTLSHKGWMLGTKYQKRLYGVFILSQTRGGYTITLYQQLLIEDLAPSWRLHYHL